LSHIFAVKNVSQHCWTTTRQKHEAHDDATIGVRSVTIGNVNRHSQDQRSIAGHNLRVYIKAKLKSPLVFEKQRHNKHQPKKKTLIPRVIIRLFIMWMEVALFNTTFDSGTDPHADSALGRALLDFKGESTTVASTDGLSACLLVNDENPRLREWMAYHYLVLPLRSLTVAVDPASKNQPNEILSRWSDMGVDIKIWRDEDYLEETERGLW